MLWLSKLSDDVRFAAAVEGYSGLIYVWHIIPPGTVTRRQARVLEQACAEEQEDTSKDASEVAGEVSGDDEIAT